MTMAAIVAHCYDWPLAVFDKLMDGLEKEVNARALGATLDGVVLYYRLVAGMIDYLSVAVFGGPELEAVAAADIPAWHSNTPVSFTADTKKLLASKHIGGPP
jgi:hypothetical protein